MVLKKNVQYLYKYLSERTYSGQLNVPTSIDAPLPKAMLHIEDRGIVCMPVLKSNKDHTDIFKENALRFYQRDLWPKALMMDRTMPGRKLYGLIQQEIDLMANSNCSLIFLDHYTGDFAGLCLNCLWEVDKNYDAFPVDPVEWLNAAGVIANEQAKDDDDQAITIWRDFQLQLYYHLYQWQAKLQKKDFIFNHFAMEIEPEFVDRKFGHYATLNLLVHRPENMFLGSYTTVPGGRAAFKKYLAGIMKEYLYVPYKSLTFERHGKSVLENHFDAKGISFQGTIL